MCLKEDIRGILMNPYVFSGLDNRDTKVNLGMMRLAEEIDKLKEKDASTGTQAVKS